MHVSTLPFLEVWLGFHHCNAVSIQQFEVDNRVTFRRDCYHGIAVCIVIGEVRSDANVVNMDIVVAWIKVAFARNSA